VTRLLLFAMGLAHRLPQRWLRLAGAALGHLLYALAGSRRRVADANLRACFPGLDAAGRRQLVRETFVLFAQGFVDRAVLWRGSAARIRAMVRLSGAEHLDALKGSPVILLAPHFVGLDAAWSRLTQDRRMATIYANQKNAAFNAALLAGRGRFGEPVLLSRQDGVREAFRALRQGLPFYFLPDMDFGPRDATFVPFFGVPAATVTAVSRLARLSGARILPCVTRLTDIGYEVTIASPWEGFPGADVETDTLRVNAFIEEQVRLMPAQYHWLHKRFKTRPPGLPGLY
jgi:KDO2-lipid IV(A) lauroyltransferase